MEEENIADEDNNVENDENATRAIEKPEEEEEEEVEEDLSAADKENAQLPDVDPEKIKVEQKDMFGKDGVKSSR